MAAISSKDTISNWLRNDVAAELGKPAVVKEPKPAATPAERGPGTVNTDPRSVVGMTASLASFVDQLNAASGGKGGTVSVGTAQDAYGASDEPASRSAAPAATIAAGWAQTAQTSGAGQKSDPIGTLKDEFDSLIYTLQSGRQPSAPKTDGARPDALNADVAGFVSDLLRIAGGFGRGVQQQAEIVAQVPVEPQLAATSAPAASTSPAAPEAPAPTAQANAEVDRRGSFFTQISERIQRHFDEL
jgi:hypothetical protein